MALSKCLRKDSEPAELEFEPPWGEILSSGGRGQGIPPLDEIQKA